MTKRKRRKKRRLRKSRIFIAAGAITLAAAIIITSNIIKSKKKNTDNENSSSSLTESLISSLPIQNSDETTEIQTSDTGDISQTETSSSEAYSTENVNTGSKSTDSSSSSERTYINGIMIVNKSYPLPSDYNPGSLEEYVLNSFYVMQDDASAFGLNIYISSGFRSYEDQDRIYHNYVDNYGQEAADTFSARPGYSEHQSGLAFDLNSIDDSFADTAEGVWVAANAHNYGFIIRYPKGKEDITGYKYESWHLRYVGVDIATELYHSGLTLEEYCNVISAYKSN